MNDPTIIMPFGKYKGEEIGDIPTGYLDWLIGQEWLGDDLKECIEDHLETRADWKRMDRLRK